MKEFFQILSDIEQRDSILIEASQKISEGERVLDIATGSGFFIRNLLKKNVAVFCIDFDPQVLIKLKKELDPMEKKARIYYICCDGTKLPISDEKIDMTSSWSAIAHIPDFRELLQEMKRVTRSKMILIEPQGDYYIRAFRDIRCEHPLPEKEEILDELSGLEIIKEEKKGFFIIEAGRIKHNVL